MFVSKKDTCSSWIHYILNFLDRLCFLFIIFISVNSDVINRFVNCFTAQLSIQAFYYFMLLVIILNTLPAESVTTISESNRFSFIFIVRFRTNWTNYFTLFYLILIKLRRTCKDSTDFFSQIVVVTTVGLFSLSISLYIKQLFSFIFDRFWIPLTFFYDTSYFQDLLLSVIFLIYDLDWNLINLGKRLNNLIYQVRIVRMRNDKWLHKSKSKVNQFGPKLQLLF